MAAGGQIRDRHRVCPAISPVPGLAEAEYLTNESVFDLEALPGRLAVLGGGAVGCDLVQAFARLGSQVTVVEAVRIWPQKCPLADSPACKPASQASLTP